jgi:hypothetical protein
MKKLVAVSKVVSEAEEEDSLLKLGTSMQDCRMLVSGIMDHGGQPSA